jgi:hypothetical protein
MIRAGRGLSRMNCRRSCADFYTLKITYYIEEFSGFIEEMV